jgi:serine/threonine protein kinase
MRGAWVHLLPAIALAAAFLVAVLAWLRWGVVRVAPISAMFASALAAMVLLLVGALTPWPWSPACVVAGVALGVGHAGWMMGALAMRPRAPVAPLTRSPQPSVGPPTQPAPIQERKTLGRYRVEREIGRGAMGAVYLGSDPKINRQVAIKTMALSQEFHGDELTEARRRFFREAETAGRLQHPDIVTIFDAGEDQELAYIAMEYLKGADLQRHTQGPLLPIADVVRIGARVAEALAYAHSQGVVHRDIKPANVMLDLASDQVKVTDFGIARISDSARTRTGMVLGTPSFMSPEQMAGRRVDGRTDLYSLGVMLYQLLTGQLPHRADSMATLMYEIANQTPPDVRNWRPEVPEPLARAVALALEKRPESRYADGRQMAADLTATLALLGAEQAPTSAPDVAQPPNSNGFDATVKLNRDE